MNIIELESADFIYAAHSSICTFGVKYFLKK